MVQLVGGGVYAALDLGTTNCRLLIARPAGAMGFRVVDSFSRIVRLGEGLEASGELTEAAIERTLKALEICSAKLARWRVIGLRAVATEACRRAANCGRFVERVRRELGLELEIITSAEEARLVLAGCTPLLSARHPRAIVFDIGGGSTEILWLTVERGADGRLGTIIRGMVSLPFGVVSLSERCAGAACDGDAFARMLAELRPALDEFDAALGIGQALARSEVQMLGSSGTVTTLAAMQLGLPRYDRARVDGVSLDFGAIEKLTQELVRSSVETRAHHPCIGTARADLMIAGCAILAAICERWPAGRLRVADRGVREGILAGLALEARAASQDQAASAACLPTTPLPT